MKKHTYAAQVKWTGNDGLGTKSYHGYRRDHEIASGGKPEIRGSSDPAFRGNPARYSPEELLVASLSSCHMLWYLHLCSANGVTVMAYDDSASGTMEEQEDGSGAFSAVVLRPRVAIAAGGNCARAMELHGEAHRLCFIANSVNFPVEIAPEVVEAAGPRE